MSGLSEPLLRQRRPSATKFEKRPKNVLGSPFARTRKSVLVNDLAASPARRSWSSVFAFTFSMLNPRSKRLSAVAYRWAIAALTALALISWLLESEPAVQQIPALSFAFDAADGFASCVFLIDYCLRLWIAPELKRFRLHSPLFARLAWLISWDALLLAAATFPFFIDMLDGRSSFVSFSWLRIFRICFLFRSSRFAQSVAMVARVCFVNRVVLFSSLTFISFMILITAALLHGLSDAATREINELESILDSTYLAILMLVGQASIEPPKGASLSPALHLVVMLTALLSVPFFAIPAGLLTWAFEGEAARLAAREAHTMRRHKAYANSSPELLAGSSGSTDDTSELEEYIQGIGGGTSSDSSGAQESALAFFASGGEGSPAGEAPSPALPPLVLLPRAQRVATELRARRQRAARRKQQRADALELLRKAEDLVDERACPGGANAPGDVISPDASDPSYDDEAGALERRLRMFAASVRGDQGTERPQMDAGAASPSDAANDGPAASRAYQELRSEVGALRAEMSALSATVAQIAGRLVPPPETEQGTASRT